MALLYAFSLAWLYVWGAVAMFAWLTTMGHRGLFGMIVMSIAWPASLPIAFAKTVRRSLAKKEV